MNMKLKVAVLQSGKSQCQVARQAGIADCYLSRVIHGWVSPGADVKHRIASALGLQVEEIF